MKIGVDFDRVLFDTNSFKRHLEEKLPGFSETYEIARENNLYNPDKHADILGVEVEQIFEEIESAKNFLYSDVKALEDIEHEIIIVSRGDQEFQGLKIQESGVLEYVDGFEVVEDGKKQVRGIDALVDDREEELSQVEVPGYLFNRKENNLDDVKNWIEKVAEAV